MKKLLLALTIAGLGLFGTSTQAAPPQAQLTPKVKPYIQPQPSQPSLGFLGNQEYGGIRVLKVFYGTPASQMGLEPGDKIVKVNGENIYSIQQYKYALTKFGGPVYLLVRDINTGYLVQVKGYLPIYNGPILYSKQGKPGPGPKFGNELAPKMDFEFGQTPNLQFQKKQQKTGLPKLNQFKADEKGMEL